MLKKDTNVNNLEDSLYAFFKLGEKLNVSKYFVNNRDWKDQFYNEEYINNKIDLGVNNDR